MVKRIDSESLKEIANIVDETYSILREYEKIKYIWENSNKEDGWIEFAKPELKGYSPNILLLLVKFQNLQDECTKTAFNENRKVPANIGFSSLKIGLENMFGTLFPDENLSDKLKEYRKKSGFEESFYSINFQNSNHQ